MEVLKFPYSSLQNSFKISSLIGCLKTEYVYFEYNRFANLCAVGCKNYNCKYSCPPHSKSFNYYSKNKAHILLNMIIINTHEQKQIYNSIRMANVIAKSIQKKAFNFIADRYKNPSDISFLENGSCRLCKKCKLQDNLPCKYPEKMHPSLEATGIDVNDLVKKAFGFELQWYKKDKFPEYQCVVGGILTNEPELIQKELFNFYQRNYVEQDMRSLQPQHAVIEEVYL